MGSDNNKGSFCFIAHPVESWNWLLYKNRGWRPLMDINRELNIYPEKSRRYSWFFPLHLLIACYFLIGQRHYDVVDRFNFNGELKGETILIRNFGWHFLLRGRWRNIRKRILAAVLDAQKGSQVIGLGALTKAEWLTKGGQWIVDELGDRLQVPIVHGDTLTAAAVIRMVNQIMDRRHIKTPIFITGATSKIGRAVVLALAAAGREMVMLTESPERFQAIQTEAGPAGKYITMASSPAAGGNCGLWITGKAVPGGRKLLSQIPRGAVVINFSVPNPLAAKHLGGRPDLLSVEGGLLCYAPEKTSLQMTMRLKRGITYACHAGTMVHAYKGWRHHECGPVDLSQLPEVWQAAEELGFFLPPLEEKRQNI